VALDKIMAKNGLVAKMHGNFSILSRMKKKLARGQKGLFVDQLAKMADNTIWYFF
jgi:hypothetical protein